MDAARGSGGGGGRRGSGLQQCPMCMRHFHSVTIVAHAASCLGAPLPAATVSAEDGQATTGRQSPIESHFAAPNALPMAPPAVSLPAAAAVACLAASTCSLVQCPICLGQFPSSAVEAHASSCVSDGLDAAGDDAKRQRCSGPTGTPAPTAVAASAARPPPPNSKLARWGALMDSERCRLLGDPQASVRRTTQHWLACQRADTRAYSKGYSNAFQDRRAPGSSSDNMRDPLYTSMRRAAAAAGCGGGGYQRR